jgi:hypothetical protein
MYRCFIAVIGNNKGKLIMQKLPKGDWPDIHGYNIIDHIGIGGYSLSFSAIQNSLNRQAKGGKVGSNLCILHIVC